MDAEKIFWGIIKFILFIPLTIIVVPSMLIMLFLHPTWESWLKEVFHIGV